MVIYYIHFWSGFLRNIYGMVIYQFIKDFLFVSKKNSLWTVFLLTISPKGKTNTKRLREEGLCKNPAWLGHCFWTDTVLLSMSVCWKVLAGLRKYHFKYLKLPADLDVAFDVRDKFGLLRLNLWPWRALMVFSTSGLIQERSRNITVNSWSFYFYFFLVSILNIYSAESRGIRWIPVWPLYYSPIG